MERHINTDIAILPPSERAVIALGSTKAEVQLRELVKESADIQAVIDPAGREQAHRAGMRLKNARLAIEKTGKAAREDATAFSQAVIAEEKRLKAITEAEEKRVLALRDAFDAKLAAEKAEADRKERERVAAIRAKIDTIRQIPATMAGEPSSEIEKEIFAIDGFQPGAEFGEFTTEAFEASQTAYVSLCALRDRTVAQEKEAARLAAEREAFEAERRAFLLEQANARRAEETASRNSLENDLLPAGIDEPLAGAIAASHDFTDGKEYGILSINFASGPDLTTRMGLESGMPTTEPDDADAIQHFRDIVRKLMSTRAADEIRAMLEDELANG